VIATVNRLADYGIYVKLDEYGEKEALVHISEISTTWVRNIRDYAREGQKLVLKVLRVNPQKGQIDLSLRRVTGRERTEKVVEWKKSRKAESIIKAAAERLKSDQTKIDEVKKKMLSKYSNIFDALEESVESGEKTFTKLEMEPEWASTLAETAKEKIKIEIARVKATIEIASTKSEGIEDVRAALLSAKKVKTPKDASIEIYTIGAPKYRIEIAARDYSDAERTLQEAVNEAVTTIRSLGGAGRQLN